MTDEQIKGVVLLLFGCSIGGTIMLIIRGLR